MKFEKDRGQHGNKQYEQSNFEQQGKALAYGFHCFGFLFGFLCSTK
jgi:hypothetical protein